MSGITTITVNVGEYKCGDCLKQTLEELKLRNQVDIVQKGDLFQISKEKQSQRYIANKTEMELNDYLHSLHEKILPKYTELHAIHSLTQKGFRHSKTYQLVESYKMIFERIVGSGSNQRIDRYEILIIPNENRIIIDGGDMPGEYCRQHAKKFQNTMGTFESFVPHTTNTAEAVKIKTQTKNYQKLGRE